MIDRGNRRAGRHTKAELANRSDWEIAQALMESPTICDAAARLKIPYNTAAKIARGESRAGVQEIIDVVCSDAMRRIRQQLSFHLPSVVLSLIKKSARDDMIGVLAARAVVEYALDRFGVGAADGDDVDANGNGERARPELVYRVVGREEIERGMPRVASEVVDDAGGHQPEAI